MQDVALPVHRKQWKLKAKGLILESSITNTNTHAHTHSRTHTYARTQAHACMYTNEYDTVWFDHKSWLVKLVFIEINFQ